MVGDLDPFVDDRFLGSCWSIETDRHFVLTNGCYCCCGGGWVLLGMVAQNTCGCISSFEEKLICGTSLWFCSKPCKSDHTFFSTRHRRCLLQNTLVSTMVGSDLNAVEEELLIS
jgi:hypothetical protein